MRKKVIVFMLVGVLILAGCAVTGKDGILYKLGISELPSDTCISHLGYEGDPRSAGLLYNRQGEEDLRTKENLSRRAVLTYGIDDLIISLDYVKVHEVYAMAKRQVFGEFDTPAYVFIYNTKSRVGMTGHTSVRWREGKNERVVVNPCTTCLVRMPKYYVCRNDRLHKKLVKFLCERDSTHRPFSEEFQRGAIQRAWLPVTYNLEFRAMYHIEGYLPHKPDTLSAHLAIMRQNIDPQTVLAMVAPQKLFEEGLSRRGAFEWLKKDQRISKRGRIGRLIIKHGYVSEMNLGARSVVADKDKTGGVIAGESHNCLSHEMLFANNGRLLKVTGPFTIPLNRRCAVVLEKSGGRSYDPGIDLSVAFVDYARDCINEGDPDFFQNWFGGRNRLLNQTKLTTAMLTEMVLKGRTEATYKAVDGFVEDVILEGGNQ